MLPELFLERMKKLLSDEEYDAFVKSFGDDEARYHGLRVNALKASDNILDKLLQIGIPTNTEENKVLWEGNGFYYGAEASPGKSPYHEAGLYYIQEPSAMSPVHYLDPKPFERVLDLCAAPGGKSTQIAVHMKGEGILVTNEINRDRAKILSLNVERLGITNALVLNEDSDSLSRTFEGYFDKILVDAPCSGEGMFRKNAEAAFSEWSLENVQACGQRQNEILDNAARMLMPGGTLVYSTCTFAPRENEETIYRFLSGHPDFQVKEVTLYEGMDNARPEWISDDFIKDCRDLLTEHYGSDREISEIETSLKDQVKRAIRLWPHKLRGEGHFLCVLVREGQLFDREKDNFVPGGRNIPAKKEIQKLFWEFADSTLSFADRKKMILKSGLKLDGTMFMFGDQLYVCDPKMPGINGLKCMRPGLHLGTIKKDRFEPSHALALAIKEEDAQESISYGEQSPEIRQFLNGQTIRCDKALKKGWTLIEVDGYSIGWAKQASGMLKNHYPKGLRINY